MTLAQERYPWCVVRALRGNLGLEETDESRDDEILNMPRNEVFKRFLTWEGLSGWECMLKEAIEGIYRVDLEESP